MSDFHEPEHSWRREKWRREGRRRGRIARFASYQRNVRRNWICLADLANWCAMTAPVRTPQAQEDVRAVASQRLVDSAKSGEFDRAGRSKVLHLDPDVHVDRDTEGGLCVGFPRLRLTRDCVEQAASAAAQFDARFGLLASPLPLLQSWWIPRDLARQWLAARGYPWPAHFDPTPPSAPVASPSGGAAMLDTSASEPEPANQERKYGFASPATNTRATLPSAEPRRRRAAYKGALEKFMARQNPLLLQRLSDDAIACEFVADYEKQAREGKLVPALPKDRRNIERQVTKIREHKNKT
jgi:hypothetical protein